MPHDESELKNEVRTFVVNQFLFGRGTVADDASFLEQGIVDSTGVLELVDFIERRFQCKVEDKELVPENLDSVNSIAAFLGVKLRPVNAA